jgi:uncharacterized protein YndB with AHSA1/START domain
MNDFGELVNSNTVRFERLLPGPIERVWSYIVEGDKRAKWLCGGDAELKVGGKMEMHFDNESLSSQPDIPRPEKYKDMPDKPSFTGSVTRYEPPHVFSHLWDFENEATEVCYELEQRDDKVLLVLTHTRLTSDEDVLSVSGGWHTHLDVLVDILEGREPGPFWKRHAKNHDAYENRLRS